MTVIADRAFTRRPHRACPQYFPHPRNCTVMWCVDHTSAPAEPGFVRYSSSEEMLAKLKTELDTRTAAVATASRGLTIDERRPALLLFLDTPLELLASTKARNLVLATVGAADSVGIYVALALTRDDREALQTMGAWGTRLLENLRRHQAGYPVYGCW